MALFMLYTTDLDKIAKQLDMEAHFYTNDSQM